MKDREEGRKKLESIDTGTEVTAQRIYQTLQIDGLRPTFELVRRFILKIGENGTRLRKHREPRNSNRT